MLMSWVQKGMEMEPIYINKTKLTYDMYKRGIVEVYRTEHMLMRAMSWTYAIVLLGFAYMFLIYPNIELAFISALLGVVIIFWNTVGFRMGTKQSFMKFAGMHQSHYSVDMEYRFYEDKLEQETEKTELTLFYNKISKIYDFVDIVVIVYDKQMIIIDKMTFASEEEWNGLVELFKKNEIKLKGFK